MPHETMPLTKTALVADLFCGAGGSSTGAKRALARLGYRMDLLALNHWNQALKTHSRNFPEARHILEDINIANPTKLIPEGKLDLLMASPSCVFHSRARGGKPINDQGRMDPWAIVRWCTELRVKRLIVENVPEYTSFGPIDLRTGRPIKRRAGEYFRAWVAALEGCGFKVQWRILNAADFGDATTRERFFLIARSDGRKLRWPEPTHSRDGSNTLFGGMQKWRAAREIIDWSIEGRSIFDRKRPLAPKTLARIYAGAVKFRWPEPFLVMLRGHMDARSLDKPLPTICAGGTHIGLAQPFILTPSTGPAPRSTDAPLPTITTGGARNADPGCARPAVVEGFILNRHGENGSVRAHTLDDPIPTADCRGAGYLVEPFIANMAHSGADESRCRSLQEPLQTLHAGGGSHGVVEPFILSQASGGAPRGVREPVPTIPAGGAHALIAPYYGSGSGESCTSPEQPLPTVTTKARFGLVVPVTNSTGGPRARSLEEPLPTMTTAKGGEFGLVMPVTHADGGNRCRSVDEPLPTVTGAHRGELAFIAAAFGERAGQAPRVHDLSEPTPTICAQGRIQLVEPVSDGRTYDIRFRMLEPHELARAMGFSDAETEYEFVGNKTEVTRMIGNAVAVHTATALVYALMS